MAQNWTPSEQGPAVSNVRVQKKIAEGQLARAGFQTARLELRQMIRAAGTDLSIWRCWVGRRLEGEPLEWLIGYTTFMGHKVLVNRGVYVPRPQSELIAHRAIELLPSAGVAADLCTGSGAIAVALKAARPGARVVATDIDPVACRCASKNGVEVYQGHLSDPIPPELTGQVDVVTAVVPYVPTDEMAFLPRDVLRYEPKATLDGGKDGLETLTQAAAASATLLRPEGSLILELGGTQDALLAPECRAIGLGLVERLVDQDGDLRGVHLQRCSTRRLHRARAVPAGHAD